MVYYSYYIYVGIFYLFHSPSALTWSDSLELTLNSLSLGSPYPMIRTINVLPNIEMILSLHWARPYIYCCWVVLSFDIFFLPELQPVEKKSSMFHQPQGYFALETIHIKSIRQDFIRLADVSSIPKAIFAMKMTPRITSNDIISLCQSISSNCNCQNKLPRLTSASWTVSSPHFQKWTPRCSKQYKPYQIQSTLFKWLAPPWRPGPNVPYRIILKFQYVNANCTSRNSLKLRCIEGLSHQRRFWNVPMWNFIVW